MRKLPNWLTAYLEYVENTEPAYLFKVWSGLSVIAAILQRKCSLKIGMNETFPNMFIILVGPSGAGKSRAIQPAKQLLRDIGVKLAAQKVTNEGLIRDLKSSFADTIQDGVMKTHSSLSIFASELAVFLRHQNQALIDDLCDLYDCEDKWDYKPKGEEFRDEIIKPYLNIIGGITPATFRSRLPQEAIGGGLTSRMICVYEERPYKYIPIHFLTKRELELYEDLKHDMNEMKAMKGEFRLTKDFIEFWTDWYVRARQYPPFKQMHFDGYNSRRPLHILKTSMNMSAARTSEMIINREDLERAIALLEQTEINMPRTFEGMGESKTAKILVDVMRFVSAKVKTNFEEINKTFYHDADKDTLKKVIFQLSAMKFLTYNSMDETVEYLEETKNEY